MPSLPSTGQPTPSIQELLERRRAQREALDEHIRKFLKIEDPIERRELLENPRALHALMLLAKMREAYESDRQSSSKSNQTAPTTGLLGSFSSNQSEDVLKTIFGDYRYASWPLVGLAAGHLIKRLFLNNNDSYVPELIGAALPILVLLAYDKLGGKEGFAGSIGTLFQRLAESAVSKSGGPATNTNQPTQGQGQQANVANSPNNKLSELLETWGFPLAGAAAGATGAGLPLLQKHYALKNEAMANLLRQDKLRPIISNLSDSIIDTLAGEYALTSKNEMKELREFIENSITRAVMSTEDTKNISQFSKSLKDIFEGDFSKGKLENLSKDIADRIYKETSKKVDPKVIQSQIGDLVRSNFKRDVQSHYNSIRALAERKWMKSRSPYSRIFQTLALALAALSLATGVYRQFYKDK